MIITTSKFEDNHETLQGTYSAWTFTPAAKTG